MAIAHFNVAIIGRSAGKSSVHAAAYASRTDLVDERTGHVHRYARNSGDVVASWVWLPKGAPEHLRDRAMLWNAVEKAETRKNSQLARRIILALPHELTAEQQQYLLKDYVRENFMRKGLAVDVNIHRPDPRGDERNDHAHILVPTRFIDKAGLGKKDRESNDRATLQAWRDDWEKKVNQQLARHAHPTRISMKTLEAQGIDREPQIHLGQGASALERKGVQTDRADQLREIGNDNQQRGRDQEKQNTAAAQPELVDRDRQNAAWQESVDQAGMAFAEERWQQALRQQAGARQAMEHEGQAMKDRHATDWRETLQRHAAETASNYQPGLVEEAGNAASGAFSFFLSFFTSLAESVARGVSRTKARPTKRGGKDKGKEEEERRRDQERKERQRRETEAILAQQAWEREQWERRKALMLDSQVHARGVLKEELSQEPTLPSAFKAKIAALDVSTTFDSLTRMAERNDARQARDQDRGGPDGLDLSR